MTALAPAPHAPQTAGGPMLEAIDLSLSFGTTPALRGANVAIAAGVALAIGRQGASDSSVG